MTLEETWTNQLAQSKWVADQEPTTDSVCARKSKWVEDNGFLCLRNDCFFCEYSDPQGCKKCPGKLVDERFFCMTGEYYFSEHPTAFYNKILELNKIRTGEEQ